MCLLWNCQYNLQLNVTLLLVLFILRIIVKLCFPQSAYNLEYIQHPFKNGVKESVDFGKVENIELFLDNQDNSEDTVEGTQVRKSQ